MSQWKDGPPKGVNQFIERQLHMKKPQSVRVLGRPPHHHHTVLLAWSRCPHLSTKFKHQLS